MSRIKALLVLGVLVALVAAAVPWTTASANHAATLDVQVGHLFEERSDPPAESMAFFPEDITVHKGDTLTFKGGFHTATALPKDVTDPDAWIAENATAPDDPYSFVKLNPDNDKYPLKLLGDNPFAPRMDCGSPSEPCTYAGDEVVDSGILFTYVDFSQAPPQDTGFSMTVDANPGDVFWVICRIHPNMRMRVAVVNPNEDTSDQATIDAARDEAIAEDRRAASELHESLLQTKAKRKVGGTTVWRAYAGFDTDRLALNAFYPRRLRVRKGDKVQWRFSQLNHEAHTVTFPLKRGLNLADRFQPFLCDPNGDDESGGETPAGFPPMCEEGVHEAALLGRVIGPIGNGKVRNVKDLEHSGIRGAGISSEPYELKFVKRGKAFKFVCVIHSFMRGTVTVR